MTLNPRFLLPLLLLAAAGCTEDQFERPGTWHPVGANDQNLLVQVANPADLQRGAAAPDDRGKAGSLAVTRLLTERRRPLLQQRSAQLGGSQEAPQQDTPLYGASGTGGSGAAR